MLELFSPLSSSPCQTSIPILLCSCPVVHLVLLQFLNLLICQVIVAKLKIHAPKGLGNSDAVDFESMWTVLSSSLREIHTKNASMLSFEELYRNAYKLVLKKKGEPLYLRVQAFEEDWLVNEIRPRILAVLSPSLLSRHGAAATTTAIERRVAGETLLRALKQAWEDHNLCMNMTADVLMYMVSIPKFLCKG